LKIVLTGNYCAGIHYIQQDYAKSCMVISDKKTGSSSSHYFMLLWQHRTKMLAFFSTTTLKLHLSHWHSFGSHLCFDGHTEVRGL